MRIQQRRACFLAAVSDLNASNYIALPFLKEAFQLLLVLWHVGIVKIDQIKNNSRAKHFWRAGNVQVTLLCLHNFSFLCLFLFGVF